MLREGQKVRIDGKIGIISFVNKLLKRYQVKFSDKREVLVPFDEVKKA